MSMRTQLHRQLSPEYAPPLKKHQSKDRRAALREHRESTRRQGKFKTRDGREYGMLRDGSVRVLNKPVSRRKKRILGLI